MYEAILDGDTDKSIILKGLIDALEEDGLQAIMDIIQGTPAGTTLNGIPITSMSDLVLADILDILAGYVEDKCD